MARQILHIDKEALDALVKRKVDEKVQEVIGNKERQLKKEIKKRERLEAELHEKSQKLIKSSEPEYFYKSKIQLQEAEQQEWLITYSDVVTLLLTMFVLLLSIAKFDVVKFEEVKRSIDKDLIKKEKITTSYKSLQKDLIKIFDDYKLNNSVSVQLDPRGIRIMLQNNSLYDLGSAKIKKSMYPVLKKIAEAIKSWQIKDYVIEVQGHTDNIPVTGSNKYESNWELSANRATNVVRYFISLGIPPDRLRAAGYADTHPLVPNTDENGKPIPENQAKNRRVEIIIERNSE